MVTDPIADFLTRIRNAQMAKHRIVEIPASGVKKRMTEILYDKGYILKYKFEGGGRHESGVTGFFDLGRAFDSPPVAGDRRGGAQHVAR
jgi:ribosomal protein S8